jgi:hypothetical protein
MSQSPVQDESARPGKDPEAREEAEPLAPEQLPAERSRFSRWLARFGLGEAPDPLLGPARTAASERRLRM